MGIDDKPLKEIAEGSLEIDGSTAIIYENEASKEINPRKIIFAGDLKNVSIVKQ